MALSCIFRHTNWNFSIHSWNHVHQNHEAETKCPPLCRQDFQMHFLERKQFYFDSSFTEIFPMGPINKKNLSIGSDNVAPNSRQAIIWTNDGIRYRRIHADVIKWKHFPRYWPFVRGIHRPPVNSPHKGQWRGALMFTLICARINGWVNNREAGDLRRYRRHYDVIVMYMQHSASTSSM